MLFSISYVFFFIINHPLMTRWLLTHTICYSHVSLPLAGESRRLRVPRSLIILLRSFFGFVLKLDILLDHSPTQPSTLSAVKQSD